MVRRLRALAARTPVVARDGLLAAVLCAIDLRTQWTVLGSDRLIGHGPVPWAVVVGYAIAGYAALAWRRRYAGRVFVVLLAHSVVAQLVLPYRPLLGLLLAFYGLVVRTSLGRSLLALLGVSGALAFTVADEVTDSPPGQRGETLVVNAILYPVLELTIWGVARLAHRSRHELRVSEEQRQAAIADERARIARELHDIVAHSVTVMVLQAAGAKRVLAPGSPRVAQALADIESTGRQAMGELRRLLGVLASTGVASGEPVDELDPHPGVDDLGPLVARVVAAGLPVDVNHRGQPRPLDTSVSLAAHRVVSEGLTNALKHGGAGARTTVLLDWHDDEVTVSVTDDGRGDRQPETTSLSSGRGLIGLDERIRAVGGRLWAGALPAGGYRVSATLPTSGPWEPP
jgi:signal transduction histidine kinase